MKCIQPFNRHSLKISAADDRTKATIMGHIYASSSLRFRKSGLLWWSSGWKLTLQCRGQRFNPWSGRILVLLLLLLLSRFSRVQLCATTCHKTTMPVSHNYWASMLQLLTCMPGARAPSTRVATEMRSLCTTTRE